MKTVTLLRAATALAFAWGASACAEDALPGGGADTVAADTMAPPTIDLDAVVTFDTFDSAAPKDSITASDTAVADGGDSAGGGDTAPDTVANEACEDADGRPFLCPCQNNGQCDSGYCIPVDEEDVAFRCSRTCDESCPNGWDCRGIAGGADPVFICQPPIDTLCDPCTEHATCGGAGDRCVAFEDGQYCAEDCQNGGSCPQGYVCGEVLNAQGQTDAYQCLPESGSCNCGDEVDYTTDPLHCGFCGRVCSFEGAIAGCADGTCFMDRCDGTHVDLNDSEEDGCEYECTYADADDWPDAACVGSDCDQDCDGIDGSVTRGIFVSASGSSSGLGTPDDPIKSINDGIALADGSGSKDHVYIAAGTYEERVDVREGVSIFGGYANDGSWRRDLSLYTTTIRSSSGTSAIRGMSIAGVQSARTVVDGVTVIGGDNGNFGGSSYGIWVANSNDSLELVRVTAIGGSGGAGRDGSNGFPGSPGVIGQPGETTTDTDLYCNEFSDYGGEGGAAGTNQCSSGRNAAGGRGGNSGCGEDGNDPDAHPGAASPGGAPGGAQVGASTNGNPGGNGGAGSAGAHGAGGLGGGEVTSLGFWRGFDGTNGTVGINGVGGGGGSGGGGDNNAWNEIASWGGGGGGGGSGGCGGTAGTAGRAAGGSFGLFLYNASPRVTTSALGHKNGGNGGRGGSGGAGGAGKAGGAGGTGHKDADNGGKGGSGGRGGRGGDGGGGAGGVAYGLYLAGASDPICAGLSFSPPGSGGTGGLGGTSGGNGGAQGLHGDRNRNTGRCQ